MKRYKFIISGGGTGGHIFPALSIADGLKLNYPDCDILFVGALGKMEMEKVPAAGYNIVGLPVAGFHRGELWRNLFFVPKLITSLWKARSVIKSFKPDCVIGVGGYASGPVLRIATQTGIPSLIQEQNSFAGVTNKILGKKVDKICVAYTGMERFFPPEKIVYTGNPVRKGLKAAPEEVSDALKFFGLSDKQPVILVTGGSLGARTLNQSLLADIEKLKHSDVQWLWQTGKFYFNDLSQVMKDHPCDTIHLMEFVQRMDLAYIAADLIISRAGAGTISELCIAGKPSILVPSPNVAEDHQTFNALALTDKDAAVMIKDADANKQLVDTALNLVQNKEKLAKLKENISKMATPDATRDIVNEVDKLLKRRNG